MVYPRGQYWILSSLASFLTIWTVYNLSKFMDDTELGGVVDSSEDHSFIQRDNDNMERWADRNLTHEVQQGEVQNPAPGEKPVTSMCWGMPSCKADLQRRTGGSW